MLARLILLAVAAVVVIAAVLPEPPPPQDGAEAAEVVGLPIDDWPMDASAARGRLVYEQNCLGCHGDEGLGDGHAATWLDPRPRNFQRAAFKFRTTATGELPVIEDIMHVIACGLEGSAMRRFPLMPEQQQRDVARYVQWLAEYGMMRSEVQYLMEDDDLSYEEARAELDELSEELMFDAYEDVWPVTVEQPPEWDEDALEIGRELYEAQCVACHGETGRGDGPSSFHLRDWKDAPIRPRDFTTGVFRAGSAPRDVFLRLKTGLNGTPMPAVYGTDEELWQLTYYILDMIDDDAPGAHPTSCAHHGGL